MVDVYIYIYIYILVPPVEMQIILFVSVKYMRVKSLVWSSLIEPRLIYFSVIDAGRRLQCKSSCKLEIISSSPIFVVFY